MNDNNDRYYRALNLPPTASPEEVHQAYRDLVMVWDPQRFVQSPHLESMAEEKLRAIIEAYHALAPTIAASEAGPAPRSPADPPENEPAMLPIADHNVVEPIDLPHAPAHVPSIFEPEPPRGMSASEVARQSQTSPQPLPAPVAPPPPAPSAAPAPSGAPEYEALDQPDKPAVRRPLSTPAIVGIALVPLLAVATGLLVYDGLWSPARRPARPPQSPDTAALLSAAPSAALPAPKVVAPVQSVPRKAGKRVPREPAATPTPLATGTELMEPQGRHGAGRFRVLNRSGQDAVVKVAAQGAGSPLRLVYVRNGTEIAIADIGPGVYLVSFSLDPVLAKHRSFDAPFGPFQFVQIESVRGAQSDEYQIVLKPKK
jgi:DnaJ domain